MTKQLEDYKELDKWFDDNQEDPANFFCDVMDSEEVAKKILELAQQLEQANERIKELGDRHSIANQGIGSVHYLLKRGKYIEALQEVEITIEQLDKESN